MNPTPRTHTPDPPTAAAATGAPTFWTTGSARLREQGQAGLVHAQHILAGVRTRLAQHERLAAAATRLAQAFGQRHRVVDTRDATLAMVVHELRAPLAPMRFAVAALARQGVPGPMKQAVDILTRQVGQLGRLVEDLADMTRLQHGKLSLRSDTVRLEQVVRAVVDDHLVLAAQGGVRIRLLPAPDAFWVRGDAARLTQVVGNLLRNAIKFSSAGQEVTLEVRREADGGVGFSVRDDGDGIAPEFIESLFEPFSQDERHRHAGQAGLGLGLSIARGLAELHGGKVAVASRGLALGSEFTVTLPAAAAPAAAG